MTAPGKIFAWGSDREWKWRIHVMSKGRIHVMSKDGPGAHVACVIESPCWRRPYASQYFACKAAARHAKRIGIEIENEATT